MLPNGMQSSSYGPYLPDWGCVILTIPPYLMNARFIHCRMRQMSTGVALLKLTVTSKATVQPVALMRLNVFVPSSRPAKGLQTSIDASSVFKDLEYSRREGYDDIRITGERLSMAVDFKV